MYPRIRVARVGLPVLAVVALCGLALSARADWPPTGAPVMPAYLSDQFPFTMASDGSGGVIVSGFAFNLVASRLTSDGELAPGWPARGLGFGGEYYINILNLPDGAGGTFVVCNAKDCVAHCGADPAQRRVIRLTGEGALAEGWPAHGIPVSPTWGPVGFGGGDAGRTRAISDESRGLIVSWAQHIGGRRDPLELRIQRMNGNGTRLWGDSGRVVRTALPGFPTHALAPDGRGGAILFWLDDRAPHLFAQRLSPEGAPMWAANGMPLASDSIGASGGPVAIEDGSRGAFVVWFGTAGGDTGIFAIRVTAGGGLPWQKPLLVLAASSGIDWLQMVAAGNGDAILAWRDRRTPGGETMHAQRISHGGRLEWGADGLSVCTAPGHKDYLALSSDDFGGAYLAWGDTRPAGEVFATHVAPDGSTVVGWDADGTPICPPVAGVWEVKLVDDGSGNAIAAWADERVPTSGFSFRVTLATRLLPHGPMTRLAAARVGKPTPVAMGRTATGDGTPFLAIRGTRPNPGTAGGLLGFSLPDDAPATLELYDVAGRRLWSRDVGGLGAGEHSVRLVDGAWLPQGIYLARLVRGREVATARLAIVR